MGCKLPLRKQEAVTMDSCARIKRKQTGDQHPARLNDAYFAFATVVFPVTWLAFLSSLSRMLKKRREEALYNVTPRTS